MKDRLALSLGRALIHRIFNSMNWATSQVIRGCVVINPHVDVWRGFIRQWENAGREFFLGNNRGITIFVLFCFWYFLIFFYIFFPFSSLQIITHSQLLIDWWDAHRQQPTIPAPNYVENSKILPKILSDSKSLRHPEKFGSKFEKFHQKSFQNPPNFISF